MKSNSSAELELSRPLLVDKISAGGIEETIIAGEKERQGVAQRFGLLELKKFEAQLTAKPTRGGRMYAVEGHVEADVVQQCVVTLEPLSATITNKIDILFVPPDIAEDVGNNPHIEAEVEETEAIVNGVIDLGELAVQHLGIALDPYPRKPGLAFVEAEYGDSQKAANPFAKLAELGKKNPKNPKK